MNFVMHHKRDFGIDAEWHCNAIAHGKCSCDGARACLKSAATRYSLQAHPNDAIFKFSFTLQLGRVKIRKHTVFSLFQKTSSKNFTKA